VRELQQALFLGVEQYTNWKKDYREKELPNETDEHSVTPLTGRPVNPKTDFPIVA
jgi:hypothetical protein